MTDHKSPGRDVEAFSVLLLDLYRYSRELAMRDFQRSTLERLRQVLPFDSAWWGISCPQYDLHSSFLFGLPAHYPQAWERIKHDDTLAQVTAAAPGITVRFDPRKMRRSPGLRHLVAEFGIQQALCTVVVNPELQLTTFLSLYRHSAAPRFSREEAALKQLVMPHLWATWTSNWIAQLDHIRAHSAVRRAALAIADSLGTLHTAEPGFLDIMRQEWPEWQGPRLPPLIQDCLRTQSRAAGSQVLARAFPVCGLFLVEVRTRSPLDRLTPRERAIADGFSRGKSHKVIALELRLSPATIRSHLRTVYAKLGISDKAQLANLVDSSHEPAAGADWEYLIAGRGVGAGGRRSDDHVAAR